MKWYCPACGNEDNEVEVQQIGPGYEVKVDCDECKSAFVVRIEYNQPRETEASDGET